MDSARYLLELQETDLESTRAAKRMEELPEKLQILKLRARRAEVLEKKEQVDAAFRSLDGQVKAFEHEISQLDTRIAGEQARLDATSDHRMVASITKEMAGCERRKNKIEFDEVALLEKLEKVRALQAQIAEALAKLDAQEAALIERFKVAGGEVQHELSELARTRAGIVSALPSATVDRYERLRAALHGIAVSRLASGRCSACRIDLSAAQLDALSQGADVSECPSCKRILVVRLDEEAGL